MRAYVIAGFTCKHQGAGVFNSCCGVVNIVVIDTLRGVFLPQLLYMQLIADGNSQWP